MIRRREIAMTINSSKLRCWTACGIGLVSFAAGSLVTVRLAQLQQVKADSNRVFELRVYHAVPGKLPVMESRFRDKTSKILARHNLNVVGYWVTEDGSDNSFIFLLAHESRDEAKKNWDAMRVDPEFQEIVKSEQAEKTLERADVTYLRPTDFSALK
jgi:NIPSNAP